MDDAEREGQADESRRLAMSESSEIRDASPGNLTPGTAPYFVSDLRAVCLPILNGWPPPIVLWTVVRGETRPRPAWLATPHILAAILWKMDRQQGFPAEAIPEVRARAATLISLSEQFWPPPALVLALEELEASGEPPPALPRPDESGGSDRVRFQQECEIARARERFFKTRLV